MIARLLDNPLLVKHLRSRLRRPAIVPMLVVLWSVCLCILWGGYNESELESGGAFVLFLVIQGLALLLIGSSQVASAVRKANVSGMLDFHRASPLPATDLTIGFLLGAPIREYLMFAAVLPFTLLTAVVGEPGLGGALLILGVLLLSSLLFHALAMIIGLLARKGRAAGNGIGALVLIVHLLAPLASSGTGFPGLLTVIPTCTEIARSSSTSRALVEPVDPTFFGLALPMWVQSVIYILPLVAFALLATTRRMRSSTAHLFSKPASIVVFATLAALTMGGLVSHPDITTQFAVPIVLCILLPCAWVLIASVTPTCGHYLNGLRRAYRAGLRGPQPWDDLASSWIPTFGLAALCAAAGFVTRGLVAVDEQKISSFWLLGEAAVWSRPLAAGLSALAFGFALQQFALAFRRRAVPYFLLFMFVAWVLPVMVGALLSVSGADDVGGLLISVCPFAAIIAPTSIGLATLGLVAAVFGYRLWVTERELARAVRDGISPTDPPSQPSAAAQVG